MARGNKSFRDWNLDDWHKAYHRYQQKYEEKYSKYYGNLNDEYTFIQFKYAYEANRTITRSTNTIRDIVARQMKVRTKYQINAWKSAAKRLADLIESKKNPDLDLANRMRHITNFEWKSNTGNAKIFWDITQGKNKQYKAYQEYAISPES